MAVPIKHRSRSGSSAAPHARHKGRKPQDRALIDKLNRVAFADHIEADLNEKLRAGGLVVSSLVAVADAGIVGHILFSDLDVRMDGRRVAAVSLAPMAVRPGEQRRGIGSQLVRAGLLTPALDACA